MAGLEAVDAPAGLAQGQAAVADSFVVCFLVRPQDRFFVL